MKKTTATIFRIAVSIGAIPLLVSCDGKSKQSTHEVSGTPAEMIAEVENILTKHFGPLPTAISDAHFIEEQIGDGVLGPSDFASFCVFRVPRANLGTWIAKFGPELASVPDFAAPKSTQPWWISRGSFPALTFFPPEKLSGRKNGWIGVDEATGKIYVYSFTM